MREPNLHTYGAATASPVSPDFTAKVFAGIGLDRYVVAASALGDVYLAWNATGVSAIRRTSDEGTFEAWYRERFERACVPAIEDDSTASAARAALRGQDVTVPIDLR